MKRLRPTHLILLSLLILSSGVWPSLTSAQTTAKNSTKKKTATTPSSQGKTATNSSSHAKTAAATSGHSKNAATTSTSSHSKSIATGSSHGKATKRTSSRRQSGQKAPTPERVSEIQQALAKDGSFSGAPNGKWDNSTVEAMKKYQSAHGLNPSGKLDARTLQRLGLGSQTAGIAAPTPGIRTSSMNVQQAEAVPSSN
jgi:peptidoglycan hydrolase-like protein with peptidoglycan-binding domain